MQASTLRPLAARSQQPLCANTHVQQRLHTQWKRICPSSTAGLTHLAARASSSSSSTSRGIMPPELADYRPNVGVCLVNKDGLVFAATRMDDPAKSWQMPQGGIDPGEDPLTAAVRVRAVKWQGSCPPCTLFATQTMLWNEHHCQLQACTYCKCGSSKEASPCLLQQ
jgi:hypothetical protein